MVVRLSPTVSAAGAVLAAGFCAWSAGTDVAATSATPVPSMNWRREIGFLFLGLLMITQMLTHSRKRAKRHSCGAWIGFSPAGRRGPYKRLPNRTRDNGPAWAAKSGRRHSVWLNGNN